MRYDVWAPRSAAVTLEADGVRQTMHRDEDRPGWWYADDPDATHGSDYGFRLDDGSPRPDPRSRWQPYGVQGPSRAYDHSRFTWTDGGWHGRPLAGSVVYELHVGTFTTEGTFDAALERLDHLVDLGVGHVELMPVAAFDGPHGWGYDGVAPYAVHEPYGGPDGLKRFVDAAHARGLAVVLDVVYNHLGPSGNYLGEFGPYFTDTYQTPWGDAVNLDGPGSDEVRSYVLDNVRSWLADYHLDGLRLDAVHALHDDRATHLLEQMAAQTTALEAHAGRPLALIAESDRNDPLTVTARSAGGFGLTAQWDDDVHHALHATLTDERQGYYADFGSLATLAKALTSAFVHDGTWSSFRDRRHGRLVDREMVPGAAFVASLQTHDQVGNRATGDRLSETVSRSRLAIGAALLLTSPFTPMLFMGEEWAASTPWQYFTSFPDPALSAAVRDGRRGEFGRHGWRARDVPDPSDEATFERSRLDWSELERSPHKEMLDWYRTLLTLRRESPELTDPRLDQVAVAFDEEARWLVVHRGRLRVVVNLAAESQQVPLDAEVERVLLASKRCYPVSGGLELDGEAVAVVRVSH
jgi:maltooligosyltrehalose trehalohydrolase